MKFRIGDKVKINKKKTMIQGVKTNMGVTMSSNEPPIWYSEDIYSIIGFNEKSNKVAILNKNLQNISKNEIHICYLKSLKKERKKKLLKLNALSIMG